MIISLHCHVISEPCAGVKCKEPKTCVVDSQGNAACSCPNELNCPPVVNTVCGSDGKTYLNDCVMKAKACEKDMDIYFVMDGYCGKLQLAFSEFPELSLSKRG